MTTRCHFSLPVRGEKTRKCLFFAEKNEGFFAFTITMSKSLRQSWPSIYIIPALTISNGLFVIKNVVLPGKNVKIISWKIYNLHYLPKKSEMPLFRGKNKGFFAFTIIMSNSLRQTWPSIYNVWVKKTETSCSSDHYCNLSRFFWLRR